MSSVKQNKDNEIRYTKNKDFTDEIAKEFLERNLQLNSDSFSYPASSGTERLYLI